MGSAASLSGNNTASSFFCDEEIVDGSKYLSEDESFRETFVSFVKSGTWKEILSCIVPKEDCIVLSLDHIGKERICIVNEYAVPRSKVAELKLLCGSDTSLQFSKKDLTEMSTSTTQRSNSSERTASSPRAQDCNAFSASQVSSILLASLYPIFAASADVEVTSGMLFSDDDTEAEDFKPAMPAITKRGQDLIHRCGRDIGEECLMDMLADPSWAHSVPDAVENYPLGITLVDTATDGFPIAYANKAYLALSGYKASQLVGQKIQILSGPDSEESQLALIREAMAGSQSAKVAVTQYMRGGKKSFLDLMAFRSCGRYSIVVHFPANKSSRLSDLKMVDDVLALLVYVMKPPPSTSTTTRKTRGHGHILPPRRINSPVYFIKDKDPAELPINQAIAAGTAAAYSDVAFYKGAKQLDGGMRRDESWLTMEESKEVSFSHSMA